MVESIYRRLIFTVFVVASALTGTDAGQLSITAQRTNGGIFLR